MNLDNFDDEIFNNVLEYTQFPEELLDIDEDFKIIYPEGKWNELVKEYPFITNIFDNNADPDYVNYQIGNGLNFNITESHYNTNVKFKCQQRVYNINFVDSSKTFAESTQEISRLFEQMHARFTEGLNPRDYIRMVFFHDSFKIPVSIPFVENSQLTPQLIIDKFEKVIQSYKNTTVNNNNSFSATVQIAKSISGGHKRKNLAKVQRKPNKKPRNQLTSYEDRYNNKSCIKTILNTDKLCAVRAILLGKAYCDSDENRRYFLNPNNRKFDSLVSKCASDLDLDPSQECTLNDIIKIEMYLKDYQICVLDGNISINQEFLYVGPINKKFIYISWHNNHFNTITSMKAYFDKSYYCDFCKIGYEKITNHYCKAKCNCCHKYNCEKSEKLENLGDKIECTNCQVTAKSFECLKIHKQLICEKFKRCYKCNNRWNRNHVLKLF